MRPLEAKIYRIRYTIAEAIFKVAVWVKPPNYELDVVRETVAMMLMDRFSNGERG